MRTKQLNYAVIIYAVLFLLSLAGCDRQHSLSTAYGATNLQRSDESNEPNELIRIWSAIDKKNIRRITILRGPEVSFDNEPIEIPQECLDGYIELLDKAIYRVKVKDATNIQQNYLKIITDKNVYLIPSGWIFNSKAIDLTTYGELWQYLEGCDIWRGPGHISYDTSGWTKLHSPRKIWPALKKENIQKIIFCCAAGYTKADEWPVVFEIPRDCLKETIRLLDKAMLEQKKIYRMIGAWMDFSGMKIITDKGKYLVPAVWSDSKYSRNKAIIGSDWASSELREYLSKCGWVDPNNQPIQDSNQPSQKPSE
jgi:hypothetical protein